MAAGFDGGTMTSSAGALPLGATNRAIELVRRFAPCFVNQRASERVEHGLKTLAGQRVMALALGYKDLVNHDTLCHEPMRRRSLARSPHADRTARFWPASRRSTAWTTLQRASPRATTR